MKLLQDRVAIVTGGAWGIGRGISLAMADAGARVAIVDQHPERGLQAAELVRAEGAAAEFVQCDVSQPEQVEAALEHVVATLGRPEILVNNAGIPGSNDPAHALSIEDWDRVIMVNLRGPFICTRFTLPHMLELGRGAIVNIASTFGMIGAHNSPSYAASKGGVIAFTRQLAVEYGAHGIRVNAISPGFIDTDMADRRTRMTLEAAAANLALRESTAALQPLGRQAQPREIGEVAAFLASDAASFMTGAIVPVDGGCTAYFNTGTR